MAQYSPCIFFLAALLLPAPGLAQAPDILGPEERCRDYSGAAVASFADADLEEVARDALGVDAQADLTCELLSGLTQLGVGSEADRVVYGGTLRPSPEKPFESLEGIQNLVNLRRLNIINRLITDIGPLSELENLDFLSLHTNWISDIGALRGMTQLEYLFLSNNRITDIESLAGLRSLQVLRLENNDIRDAGPIRGLNNLRELSLARNYSLYDVQPLFANEGIGAGDELDLRFTYVSCADMDAFAARGANLLRVTALNGSACPGRRLEDP